MAAAGLLTAGCGGGGTTSAPARTQTSGPPAASVGQGAPPGSGSSVGQPSPPGSGSSGGQAAPPGSGSSGGQPAPPGSGSSTALTVTPSTGRPTTTFRFGFRPRAAGGRRGNLDLSYSLTVSGPAARPRCVAERTAAIPVARAGTSISATLAPGGRWCVGRYTARVEELARPVCRAGHMCPQFIRIVATIGPATFRVTAG